jgi:membrane protein
LHLGGLTVYEAALRTWKGILDHEILTRAAAISFYGIAALVPFLALVITLTAHSMPWIVPDAGKGIDANFKLLSDLLPPEAVSLILRELGRLQAQEPHGLISFGLLALLWLSSSLFVAIIDAMNVIRGVKESRPFWKRRLIAVGMTLSQAAILIAALATIVAWPQILTFLGLSQPAATLATIAHGIIVFLMVLLSFGLTLYLGPDDHQHWEWITPGSLHGTVDILAVSLLFREYAQNWGHYTATYGSLAGIVVLMSWLWLCSLELLIGAELNKVVEDAASAAGIRNAGGPWVSRR